MQGKANIIKWIFLLYRCIKTTSMFSCQPACRKVRLAPIAHCALWPGAHSHKQRVLGFALSSGLEQKWAAMWQLVKRKSISVLTKVKKRMYFAFLIYTFLFWRMFLIHLNLSSLNIWQWKLSSLSCEWFNKPIRNGLSHLGVSTAAFALPPSCFR